MDWSEARDSVEALKKMCGRQAITILGINAQIRTEAMPISFRDKIVCFRGDFRDVLLSNMRTIGKANIEHLAMGQVQFTSNLQFLAQYVRLKSVTLHFYGSVGVRLLQCLGDLEAFKKIPDVRSLIPAVSSSGTWTLRVEKAAYIPRAWVGPSPDSQTAFIEWLQNQLRQPPKDTPSQRSAAA